MFLPVGLEDPALLSVWLGHCGHTLESTGPGVESSEDKFAHRPAYAHPGGDGFAHSMF